MRPGRNPGLRTRVGATLPFTVEAGAKTRIMLPKPAEMYSWSRTVSNAIAPGPTSWVAAPAIVRSGATFPFLVLARSKISTEEPASDTNNRSFAPWASAKSGELS
ncbi:MAG: hypothetical protein DMG65_01850 [Candidatus Angelobacter sp. Gp1-AA117]|nr:MAG: hypothetical protein DMG65_01850 [Candidatus Angelobacter sp. Gp1-AA117]